MSNLLQLFISPRQPAIVAPAYVEGLDQVTSRGRLPTSTGPWFCDTDFLNSVSGTQYLFLPPNRYIFHGAEVYSDSEDDIMSSSSCGSSSESGSCRSQSLDVEDESEIEEFYNGIEDEDAPEREEEAGFGEDGVEQDAVDESAYTNEAARNDPTSNKL